MIEFIKNTILVFVCCNLVGFALGFIATLLRPLICGVS